MFSMCLNLNSLHNCLIMRIIPLVVQVDVAEKIKHAPDGGYQIGVIIGSFIPFVILIGIAYWMYNRAKKRDENGY